MPRLLHLFRTVLIALTVWSGGSSHLLSAQDSTPGSSTSADQPDLRFGILPAGDYSGSYFQIEGINPGDSVALEATIVNAGRTPVKLRAYNTNAYSGINGGFVAGGSEEPLQGSALWVEFPEWEKELAPGAQELVSFTVTVPRDTPPGQYISGLIVETVDTIQIPGSDMFDQRIRAASAVMVMVPGEIIHSFEMGSPIWDRGYVAVPIHNTGNYLIELEGEVQLRNGAGTTVLTAPIKMGSIYGGLESALYVELPGQLPGGEYRLDLILKDPNSGVTQELTDVPFVIPEPEDPTGIFLIDSDVQPNAEEIVFANLSITLDNGGAQIPAADVVLEVSRDGKVIEEYQITTNQVLIRGENVLTDRYIPEGPWEPGTYTFRIIVYAVDPNGGQQTEILNEPLDAELTVP